MIEPDDETDAGAPEPLCPDDPEWLRYEKDVKELLASKDPSAKVEHNHKRKGRSGRTRQIDALVTGTVCGFEIEIAVEAKRYKYSIGIGIVDAFIGKCLDTGVDQGVLYSPKGFGAGAVARAEAADHPKVRLRTLELASSAHPDVDELLTPWAEVLPDFLDFRPCPGDECWGEVFIRTDLDWSGGVCDQCGTPAGECRFCETFQQLPHDDQECSSCSGVFVVTRERDSGEVEDIRSMAGFWDH